RRCIARRGGQASCLGPPPGATRSGMAMVPAVAAAGRVRLVAGAFALGPGSRRTRGRRRCRPASRRRPGSILILLRWPQHVSGAIGDALSPDRAMSPILHGHLLIAACAARTALHAGAILVAWFRGGPHHGEVPGQLPL